ncbi:enoyl-CoA hydratase/isomerase family protein [Streptomyces sp. TR1341]|uniref:enoyl-CoA-hydratase DpgB n=1 Tax=Streptomyces sp. TR1341 TaxID=2601266 RepID=UPI00138AC788|nr:enoyl-CoA hydratase/isomerase family protein [Streptomyces sp. TR1341]
MNAQLDADFGLTLAGADTVSAALIAEVNAVCDRVEDTADGDLLILRLKGGAAADTTGTHDVGIYLINKWERTLRRLERLPVATVALVDGACGGASAELLLATDYRITSDDLKLRLPVAAGATWPGMALYRLATQLGVAGARRLALFGNEVDAQTALRAGLVDELAQDLAGALAARRPLFAGARDGDLAIRRRLLMDAAATRFDDALGAHLAAGDRAQRRSLQG